MFYDLFESSPSWPLRNLCFFHLDTLIGNFTTAAAAALSSHTQKLHHLCIFLCCYSHFSSVAFCSTSALVRTLWLCVCTCCERVWLQNRNYRRKFVWFTSPLTLDFIATAVRRPVFRCIFRWVVTNQQLLHRVTALLVLIAYSSPISICSLTSQISLISLQRISTKSPKIFWLVPPTNCLLPEFRKSLQKLCVSVYTVGFISTALRLSRQTTSRISIQHSFSSTMF